MPTTWHPCALLNGHPLDPYAVIILNQSVNSNALDAVIGSASLLICADGGANRLYSHDRDAEAAAGLKNGMAKSRTRLPDAIIGDLDSLAPDVEEHYGSRGVEVVNDPDQYSTDFTKCLKYVRNWARSRQNQDDTMDVVVLGGLGGRVDQGFSQIHHLYMAENDPALLKGRIYLLSEQSLSFVLSSVPSFSSTTPGGNDHSNTNIIYLQPGYFAENVGILPILGRTLLATRGLEWDVEQWPTEFGGQVSTSNHIRADKIEIEFEGRDRFSRWSWINGLLLLANEAADVCLPSIVADGRYRPPAARMNLSAVRDCKQAHVGTRAGAGSQGQVSLNLCRAQTS